MQLKPRAEARRIRMDHWNTPENKIPFPVDPFLIADRLGIEVRKAALDHDLAGFIIREQEGGPVEIYVNAADADVRQRFTVAHEIGHFVQRGGDTRPMGFVDERSELSASGTDPNEIWANRFAAELLMPSSVVRKWWARGISPDALRRKFFVSTAAIGYRLDDLGLTR